MTAPTKSPGSFDHHQDRAGDRGLQVERDMRVTWLLLYLGVLGIGLVIAVLAYRRSQHQLYLGIGLVILVAVIALWMRFPKAGLAVTVALSLMGDNVTVYWYPFVKNFSSHESVMYLGGGLPLSPFEIVIVAALIMTALRNLHRRGVLFRTTPLFGPFVLFTAMTAFGLVWGISRGGDIHAALFEIRPVLYLPVLYLLITNVCENRRDYRRMFWFAVGGITVQAVLSVESVWSTPVDERLPADVMMEHGSAISMNLVFILLIATIAFKGIHRGVPLALVVVAAPMLVMYFESQRRAAFLALVGGVIVLAVILFWEQRRTFYKLVPLVLLPGTLYIAAMWNAESSAAFPARAVKSVVAPDQLPEADRSSNEYRDIENFNLHFTIRSAPLTGIGFGNAFYRPIPLADISFFEFHEYLPHNSLLWIWTKTGFIGFAAFFYLIAKTLALGSDRMRRAPLGIDRAMAFTAVAFVVMFTIFMYVDIAWGPRNALLLALSMALCTGPLSDEADASTTDVALDDHHSVTS